MPGKSERTDLVVDLGSLTRQWDVLDALYTRYDSLPNNPFGPDLFDRFVDEQQPAGHRVYIGAAAHIDNAREHNELLRRLLSVNGPTPRVPWTLLRSVFESGFWATWLLEPDDGLERRRRGLRLEVLGYKERRNFYKDYLRVHPHQLAKVTESHLEHEKRYRDEAAALKMDWALANQKVDMTSALKQLQVVRDFGHELDGQTEATWRSLSGAQHGHTYALMHLSDIDSRGEILGGETGRVTISDDALQIAGTITYALHASGLALFVARSTSVYRQN